MGNGEDDGRTSRPTSASDLVARPGAGGPSGPEVRLDDLILFDSAGNDPERIEAMVFTDEGIGVVRTPGGPPRMLPWSAVSAHVVEPWAGGVVPAWWAAPQPRPDGATRDGIADDTARERVADGADRDRVADEGDVRPPPKGGHRLPRAGAGAVIAVQTPFGTYRFLRPGADPVELSNRITDVAV